jgi:hypothetical protein
MASLSFVLGQFLFAGSAGAATMVMGRGVPPWTLGQKRVVKPSIERTESHPENNQPGCVSGLTSASRIDHYPYWVVGILGGHVFDITTSRPGDRSTDGFVIGEARFRAVRAKHPRAHVGTGAGDPFAFGNTVMVVFRSTGYESGITLRYWFAADRLVALSTGFTGC